MKPAPPLPGAPLPWADRLFIRAVAPRHATYIERWLAQRPAQAFAMNPAEERTLWQDLRSYGRLLVAFAARCLRASPARDSQASIHEWVAAASDASAIAARRIAFVQMFTEDHDLFVANRDVKTARVPFTWPVLRMLGGLAICVAFAGRSHQSELTRHFVSVVAKVLHAYSHARVTGESKAYLFRTYQLQAPFTAAFLRERGLQVYAVVGGSHLAAYNRVVICDVLVVSTPYQLDELKAGLVETPSGSVDMWGPADAPALVRYRARHQDNPHASVVGVYPQGFVLRRSLGLVADSSLPGVGIEEALLDGVCSYAREHPSVQIRIFPHPFERRHYASTGWHAYESLAREPNVSVDIANSENSYATFDEVGLGLTVASNIGFERLWCHRRTLFYIGDHPSLVPSIESEFQSVFIRDPGSLTAAIDEARGMTNDEFFERYLPGAYDDVDDAHCVPTRLAPPRPE